MNSATAIFVALVASASTAYAQKAVLPCEAYWNASAVFVGRVESVRREGTNRVLSVAVVDPFRGVSSSAVDVTLVMPRQGCSLLLKPGSEHFVYADRRADGGLSSSACSFTRLADDASADLEYARAVRQGTAPTGYLTGHVTVGRRTIAGKDVGLIGPAPMLTVNLSTADVTVATTRTSGDTGWFRVDGPGAGSYRLSLELPDGFYVDGSSREVTLLDARGCANVDAVMYEDGHVNGRVVDAGGRPVAGLTLELGPPNGSAGRRTVTDRDGRYELTKIPAGRFLLSVPADRRQASRLFFPGADVATTASRIALTAGERKRLEDFRIPSKHAYVPVSGVVLDADGTPAEGARVFLKGVGDDDRIVSEPVVADFMGRFVIAARAGAEYGLFAERPRPGGRTVRVDSTDTVRVTAAEKPTLVRLTLARRY